VRRAVKLRIYPTLEQVAFLDRQFGAVRFVWNKALAIKTHRYRVHGDRLSAKHDLKPLLVAAKRSRRYGWLAILTPFRCNNRAKARRLVAAAHMNVFPMPEATSSTSFLGGCWTKTKPSASRP
jgi:transposase